MSFLFVFGLGYSASHIATRLRAKGWRVAGTGRGGTVDFDDSDSINLMLGEATHILSSVPPDKDCADPVLLHYGRAIATGPARWVGYLSSTGVYGDTGGAWVDESAPIGMGRRAARTQADLAWQSLHAEARVFRLPGIYGPGRSVIDRIRAGTAHRIDLPEQVFSRVHIDDIASGVEASFAGPPGVFNLADDHPCAQNALVEFGCRMLGVAPPPLQALDDAGLSPAARAFYAENRRVSNGKAKRLLGWRPIHADYRTGLTAATVQPTI